MLGVRRHRLGLRTGARDCVWTTLQSLGLTPPAPSGSILSVVQMTASAVLSNGTSQNVTASATWSSSNPLVATVSALGLVVVVAIGTTVITATYAGRTAQVTFTGLL